ncbi:MAG: dihydrofolate reductase family protein [Thermoplasmata archaeon]
MPGSLPALELLLDRSKGRILPLPPALSHLYGPLRLSSGSPRAHVLGNFATTLDGVVSLSAPGASTGAEITGFNPHDRLLMGILRAVTDAVIIGAGTLRAVRRHIWTAEHVFPPMAAEFGALRHRLGKPKAPLTVVVTATGRLDLRLPTFSRGEVPVLIVTTTVGSRRLASAADLPSVKVVAVRASGRLRAAEVLNAVRTHGRYDVVLVEGGPHLIGSFFAEKRLDELFLTLAPQIAGRNRRSRPGLVAGRTFAPEHPLWGSLVGVRRGGSLLFLRFAFGVRSGPSRRAASPN